MRSIVMAGILFVSLLNNSCTKSFSLKTDTNRPMYVIEGRVSNMKGPYYVRVTRVANLTDALTPPYGDSLGATDNAVPVLDAQVVIWDEAGDSDTLQSISHLGEARYLYSYNAGKWDSTFQNISQYYPGQKRLGYYKTTHLTGVAGHTYHLKVTIDKEEYQATAYMPPVPELDSANNKPTIVEWQNTPVYLPCVYFKEPPAEKNYYLFQYNSVLEYPYDYITSKYTSFITFPYYVVDDNTLPAYVDGLRIKEVPTFQGGIDYANIWSQGQVRLCSLTKEAYDYYAELAKQFKTQGNAYRPSPASPAGNISNGAIGLFYASAVSYKFILTYP